GTPLYMAPEQARGETIDGRADLFSLGCILYLMIAGRPPFEGTTTMAVLSAVITETPAPVTRFNSAIPGTLSDLLARLLAKQPAPRRPWRDVSSRGCQALGRGLFPRRLRPAPRVLAVDPAGPAASPADHAWSGIQPLSPSVATPVPEASASLPLREPGTRDTP